MHVDLYLRSLAAAMGLEPERFGSPGISVVFGDDRRGQGLVSHYRVDEHSVVWADADLADRLSHWNTHGASLPFDQFRAWALELGAERLGAGYEHVLDAPFEQPAPPPEVAVLDPGDPDVIEMATELHEACPAADVEEADFDLAALDEHLAGVIRDGRLDALAGARPFDLRPGFHDIGPLVRPDARRKGLGTIVVAAVVRVALAAGHRPLYRCSVDHEASWRLCRGLGFVPVVELEAFRWPAAN